MIAAPPASAASTMISSNCVTSSLQTSCEKPALAQERDDGVGELVRAAPDRSQVQLGGGRRLVRRIEAGEVLDLAGLGLRVESLRIPPHAFLDRRVDKNLDELALLDPLAHHLSFGCKRRDEG